jgi:hypothetical protein
MKSIIVALMALSIAGCVALQERKYGLPEIDPVNCSRDDYLSYLNTLRDIYIDRDAYEENLKVAKE